MRAVAMSQPENLNSSSQLQQIRLQKKTSLLRGKKIIKENSQSQQIRLQKESISLLCGKIIIGKNARLQQIRLQKDSQEQRLFLKTTYKRRKYGHPF